MKVKEAVSKVMRVSSDMNVADLSKFMFDNDTGSVLIEEAGRAVGLITERDILRKVVAKGMDPMKTMVTSIMTYPLETIEAGKDVAEASSILAEKKIRRLFVTEHGKIIGKISVSEISKNVRYLMGDRMVSSYKPDYYRESALYPNR